MKKRQIFRGILAAATAAVLAVSSPASLLASEQAQFTFNNSAVTVTADGYVSSAGGGVYEIGKGFTVTLPANEQSFNKYSLTYSATVPLAGTITYSSGEAEHEEDFFLEAGENLTFSSYIDRFTTGRTMTSVNKLTLGTIRDESCTLTLKSASVSLGEVTSDKTVYLENDRYRVGINLLWGGGISYIEDKQDNDPSITNMLNRHDTGRLVQQSYYGTTEAPYVLGNYNDVPWAYNPVQGGDLYNNASKLVDYEITDTYIYVKSRPLDWGHDNLPTYAYMENRYELQSDNIRVYNSMIDFSNYNNPKVSQELPAFYTISNFSRFVYYNGTSPWTDGELIYKDNLPFWGDSNDGEDVYVSQNSETWMAWVSESDFGVGLYVPNVTHLKAGRHQFDNSKDSMSDSTNYVAPLRNMTLLFGEKIEYSYIISSGSVAQMRSVFKANRDFSDNAGLDQYLYGDFDFTSINFTDTARLGIITRANDCIVTGEYGLAKITVNVPSSVDPYALVDYTGAGKRLEASEYPYIVITYMAPQTNSIPSANGYVYFGAGDDTEADGDRIAAASVVCNGKFRSVRINMSRQSEWTGNVNFLRLDFFNSCVEGDTIYIKSIALAKTLDEAKAIGESEAEAGNALLPFGSGTQTPDTSGEDVQTGEQTSAPDTSGDTSPSTDSPSEQGASGISPWIYVGAAGGVAVVAAAVVFIIKRKKS